MKSFWRLSVVVILAAGVGACSSSEKSGDDFAQQEGYDEIPVADAGTDAVPAQGGELAAQPTEGMPADSGAPPVPFEGSGQFESYTIRQGDTLMKVAFEFYGDLYQWRRIYQANQAAIPDPGMLKSGTVIQVEKPSVPVTIERNGEQYEIKSGDTLGTISNDVYGTPKKWRRLHENNRQLIKDANKIYAGFYLYYILTPEDVQEKQTLGGGAPMAGGDVPIEQPPAGVDMAAPPPGDSAVAPVESTEDTSMQDTGGGERMPAGQ